MPSQGRVSQVNLVNNYVVVEDLGDALSSSQDSLASFVNIVDGETGEIKQSLQIGSIVGSRLTFRTSPTRTSVLNRDIDSAIDASVSADDYVNVIKGTCVPFFAFPIYNFIVQYAANEMNRKLKNESITDQEVIKKFEEQVRRSWAGREMTMRVKMRSSNWTPKRARRSRVH